MTPFRERNPIPIAVIGLAVLLGLLLLSFNADKLPFIGAGRTLTADFANSSGLKPNDDVRIAGIKVGKVSSVSLHGSVVRVTFTDNSGVRLGSKAAADIKIKTLLGQKYIDLQPAGSGDLHGTIPVSRTQTPLVVTEAFIGLGRRAGEIDTTQLAKAFDTLSATFSKTPPHVQESLKGLSRLSETIASRDQQLGELLKHANSVSGVLADRNAQITKLIKDADLVLTMVEDQRTVIHDLLVNTAALSKQLDAVVKENRQAIKPALDNLHSVLNILAKHRDDLDTAIHELAPFVRNFDNTLGNGHFFDNFIADLPPGEFPVSVQGSPSVQGGAG